MVLGIFIWGWDEREGFKLLGKYPNEFDVSEKLLMHLYSQHEFSGNAGFISLQSGVDNIASYYDGVSLYLVIFLSNAEDPDIYEEILEISMYDIFLKYETQYIEVFLPKIFEIINSYQDYTVEQKLMMVYAREITHFILEWLRNEVSLTKIDIELLIRDQFKPEYMNFESILRFLRKNNIVRSREVNGDANDVIFLANDILVARIPPVSLYASDAPDLPSKFIEVAHRELVQKFFGQYIISIEDNIKLINLLLDPEIYAVIRLFRQSPLRREDLEKLRDRYNDLDIDYILKILYENNIIACIQDGNRKEYFILITDFIVKKLFPSYIIDKIQNSYNLKTKNNNVLLSILQGIYDTTEIDNNLKKKIRQTKKGIEKLLGPFKTEQNSLELFYRENIGDYWKEFDISFNLIYENSFKIPNFVSIIEITPDMVERMKK